MQIRGAVLCKSTFTSDASCEFGGPQDVLGWGIHQKDLQDTLKAVILVLQLIIAEGYY